MILPADARTLDACKPIPRTLYNVRYSWQVWASEQVLWTTHTGDPISDATLRWLHRIYPGPTGYDTYSYI